MCLVVGAKAIEMASQLNNMGLLYLQFADLSHVLAMLKLMEWLFGLKYYRLSYLDSDII